MTADTRLWMYRKGESRLFGHPDLVPENEAWERFPAEPGETVLLPKTQGISLPEPGPDAELTDQEKLERMSRQRLMQVAADCGVRFDISWTKVQLKHAIVEMLNDNGP